MSFMDTFAIILVSSAKSLVWFLITLAKPLINKIKRRGPKTDPWMTLLVTFSIRKLYRQELLCGHVLPFAMFWCQSFFFLLP